MKKKKQPTLKSHREHWEHCTLCKIGSTAANHVLGRGTLPCDLLFIGEAPGHTEDVIGEPFVGRSGRLLNQLIKDSQSFNEHPIKYTHAITNTIACCPFTSHGYEDALREPLPLEIRNCQPRLEEYIQLASPRAIIMLGKVASKNFPYDTLVNLNTIPKLLELPHPAWILRNGGEASLAYKRVAIKLHNFAALHLRHAKKSHKH